MIDIKKLLLPCAFCDKIESVEIANRYPNYIIKCCDCGVEMSNNNQTEVFYKWNNRVLINRILKYK